MKLASVFRAKASEASGSVRGIVLLMLLAALSIAAGLGLREPSPPDEPRFVLAAKHMVDSGDWLVPHRGREFYAEKPPVFMWIQAATYNLVPDWKLAFLLPSLLAALGTLWLTWDLARRLWGPSLAIYAPAALWACVQFGLQAKRWQIDMVLVFMTTLSLWGLMRHLLRGPNWGALWLGAFAAGVGTVTKGVGFLPLLVLIPWAVTRWAIRTMPRAEVQARGAAGPGAYGWRWALMALAFIVGTAVWLGPLAIALAARNDPALQAYASELLFKQTGERYASAWHHVQPAWYYLQVMLTLWLPGALLLPWLLPGWWRQLRERNAEQWLLLGWALLVLIFFSASPGKREVYIFPMLPALCVAAAPLLPALLQRRGVQWTLLGYVAVFSLVLAALGASGSTGISGWAQKLADQRDIGPAALQNFLAWLLAAGSAGVLIAAWARLRRSGLAAVLFAAVLWVTYGVGLAPSLDATSSGQKLMRRVGAHIGPDAQLGMIAWREQNLLQADRAVTDFGFKQPWQSQWREASRWLAQDPQRRWLFVLAEAQSPCVDPSQVVAIGQSNRRDWVLVPGTALVPGCVTPALADEQADGS